MMKKTGMRLFLLLLLCTSGFALFPQDQPPGIRFGHTYGENSAVIYNKYSALIRLLSEELGRDVELVVTSTYGEMKEAYLAGKIDMGIINAYSYLDIMDSRYLLPIAARVKEHEKTYSSLLVVRKDSPINSVLDLENKILALGDPDSTSAFLVPMYSLREMGIDPESFFRQVAVIPKQDSILYAIMNRTADCGAVASFILNEQEEAVKDRFRIIFQSRSFPLGPFIVNTRLGEEIIGKTRAFLLGLADTEEGRRALIQADLDPFSTVEKSDYDWLKGIADSGYGLPSPGGGSD